VHREVFNESEMRLKSRIVQHAVSVSANGEYLQLSTCAVRVTAAAVVVITAAVVAAVS
jgi:hypothetical protein